MYTNVETYRMRQKKTTNMKTAISQKCVNIIAPNFAFLLNCPRVYYFMLFLLDVCQNDGNLNLENEFRN